MNHYMNERVKHDFIKYKGYEIFPDVYSHGEWTSTIYDWKGDYVTETEFGKYIVTIDIAKKYIDSLEDDGA